MRPILFWMVLSSSTWISVFAQPYTLQGFITDKATGQALIGVTLTLSRPNKPLQGTVTNKDGYYQFSRLEKAAYQLRITAIGFKTYERSLVLPLATGNVQTLSLGLDEDDQVVGELVVEAQRGAAVVAAGLQTIRPEDIGRVPTPDISGDLSSYLQSLPGVVSVGDRGGQMFIRGGTPAENLVLMDGLPVVQPFHLIGFYSVFPQDLISTADVYAGGFGARYSGKTSSVIAVNTRDGNNQKASFSASISPFLGTLQGEGPLHKGKSSYLASVRSSLIKPLAPVLLKTNVPVQFGEQFFKVTQADEDSRCSAMFLNTYDQGSTDNGNAGRNNFLAWKNLLIGGRCVAFPPNQPLLFEVISGLSYFQNRAGNLDATERNSSMYQVGADVHFTRFMTEAKRQSGVFFKFNGYEYKLGGAFQDFPDNSDETYISGGLYTEWSLNKPRFEATGGVSFTAYLGDFRPALEPRLRLAWYPKGKAADLSIHFATGLYNQKTVGLRDERDIGSAFLAWTVAPKDLRVAQVISGLHFPLAKGVQVSVEGYYKRIMDLYVPIWSPLARFTTALTTAFGTAYGAEARIEVQRKPIYLYASYAYNHVRYTISQPNFLLWYGAESQTYAPPHDQPHQLNLVSSYDWRKIRLNARWQYGAGFPYTQAFGFDDLFLPYQLPDVRTEDGLSRIIYDKPYLGRLPAYHRLDVSVEHERAIGKKMLSFQAGVINGYNRKNLFYFDLFTYQRINQLPFIPYFAVKFEW